MALDTRSSRTCSAVKSIEGSRETRGRIDADRATRVVGSLGVCPDVSYEVAKIAGAGLKCNQTR
jgi:hypothetical protein